MPTRRDDRSPEAARYRKLYGRAEWKRARAAHLAEHPLCERCLKRGIVNDGSRTMKGEAQRNPKRRYLVVHHVEPHKGDLDLFFNGRKETLCPDHHDIEAQQEEHGRVIEEIDPRTGLPVMVGGGSKV